MEKQHENNQRTFYLQVKVSKRVKRNLIALAEENHRTVADIIRGALYFGIPMLEHVLAMEEKLTGLLARTILNSEQGKGRPLKEIFDKFR